MVATKDKDLDRFRVPREAELGLWIVSARSAERTPGQTLRLRMSL
jgi:hypothetical protein